MNFFSLYSLPISFQPDLALVKARYYTLSRQFHPDLHGQASEEDQTEVLEKASMVNMAYKVFRNPDETIKYVLKLKGLLQEEEKYQLATDFLMEMLELNEQVMEREPGDAATATKLTEAANAFQQEILAPVANILAHYEDGVTTEKELLVVKEYYYRKKYLDRILAGLQ